MALFSITDAAKYGYATTWENRETIARHAMLPLMIKLGSLAAILLLGIEQNYLRQGLILLPSFFAEGFLVAFILKSILTGRDLNADPRTIDATIARNLIASMIIYVLIKLMLSLTVGMTFLNMEQQAALIEQSTEAPPPDAAMFLSTLFMLGFSIWAFRFLWFYIPAALGESLSAFWVRINGFNSSLTMIGCWLLCFLPFGIAMMIYMQFVLGLLPPPDGETPGQLAKLLVVIGQGVIELAMVIVSSLAMAHGFQHIKDQKHKG